MRDDNSGDVLINLMMRPGASRKATAPTDTDIMDLTVSPAKSDHAAFKGQAIARGTVALSPARQTDVPHVPRGPVSPASDIRSLPGPGDGDMDASKQNGAADRRQKPQRQQRKRLRPVYLTHYADGEALDMLRLSQAEDGGVAELAAVASQDSLGAVASAGLAEAPLAEQRGSETHSAQQIGSKHAPYEPDEQDFRLSDSSPQPQKKRGRAKTEQEKALAAAAKEKEKAERKAAREQAKLEKAAQREEEKRRKAEERELRQRQNGKTALEDILPVICPSALNHATTLRIMERLQADSYRYDINGGVNLPLGGATPGSMRSILWRRRVYGAASADGADSQGVSLLGADTQYESVPYVLVYVTGEEFVAQLERDGSSIEPLLARVAVAHPGHTFGLLLEGLQSHLKRRQDREFRELGPGGGGFNAEPVNAVLAALAVDQPGVRHRCVPDAAAAADHVAHLTRALANQPFKVQDSYLHQFGGSGKGGTSARATLARYPLRSRALEPWYQALCYVADIAPGQAHAIVSAHASLGSLMCHYMDASKSQKEKEELLSNLTVPAGTQRVGPCASKKLFALLTATDPLMPLGELGLNG